MTNDELRSTLPSTLDGIAADDTQELDRVADAKVARASHASTGVPVLPKKRKKSTIVKVGLVAALVLALVGGGTAVAVQNGVVGVAPKVEPPKEATAIVDGTMVSYKLSERGTAITVTGEDGKYYTADLDGIPILIEKAWVRLASEEQPKPWKAFTREDGTPVFAMGFMLGDPLTTLAKDTEVTVVDEKDNWIYIETADGKAGFAYKEHFISEDDKKKADEAKQNSENDDSQSYDDYYYDYGYSSGGSSSSGSSSGSSSSGGSSSSTPAPDPTPSTPTTSGDGGDISLASVRVPLWLSGAEPAFADEKNAKGEEAVILTDGAPMYLAKLKRGESVHLSDSYAADGDSIGTVLVVVNEQEGTVPRLLVHLPGDIPFVEFDGHAVDKAVIYADYELTEQVRECAENDVLHVVDEYDENYVIEDKGVYYYAPKSSIMPHEIQDLNLKDSAEKKEGDEKTGDAQQDASSSDSGGSMYYEPSYSSSGSSGSSSSSSGSSSGGPSSSSGSSSMPPADSGGSSGGSSASSEPEPEWSNPVL